MTTHQAIAVFVFDVDGTLFLVGDRIECLQRAVPSWDEFYERCDEDEPNMPVVLVCRALISAGHAVWMLTGRRESVRDKTEAAFAKCGIAGHRGLLMRPDGDHRHDIAVKPELLQSEGIIPTMIFEDRNSVVRHWRRIGIPCAQVADGDF